MKSHHSKCQMCRFLLTLLLWSLFLLTPVHALEAWDEAISFEEPDRIDTLTSEVSFEENFLPSDLSSFSFEAEEEAPYLSEELVEASGVWLKEITLTDSALKEPILGDSIEHYDANNIVIDEVLAANESGGLFYGHDYLFPFRYSWTKTIPTAENQGEPILFGQYEATTYYLCLELLTTKEEAFFAQDVHVRINGEEWNVVFLDDAVLVAYKEYSISLKKIHSIELRSRHSSSYSVGETIPTQIYADVVTYSEEMPGTASKPVAMVNPPVWVNYVYEFMKPFYWDFLYTGPTMDYFFKAGVYHLCFYLEASDGYVFDPECECFINGERIYLASPISEDGMQFLAVIPYNIGEPEAIDRISLLLQGDYDTDFFDMLVSREIPYYTPVPEISFALDAVNGFPPETGYLHLGTPYFAGVDGTWGLNPPDHAPASVGSYMTESYYLLCLPIESDLPIDANVQVNLFAAENFFSYYPTGDTSGLLYRRIQITGHYDAGDFTLDVRNWNEQPVMPLGNQFVAERLQHTLYGLYERFGLVGLARKNGLEYYDLDKDGHADLVRHTVLTWSRAAETNLTGTYILNGDYLLRPWVDFDTDLDTKEVYQTLRIVFSDDALQQVTPLIILEETSFVFTGKKMKPLPASVELFGAVLSPSQYALSYEGDCLNAGTHKLIATMTDAAYTGSSSVSYTITPANIKKAKIILEKTEFTYDGKQKMPKLTITYGTYTLTEGIDYTLIYRNNVSVGTASVKIKGKGNFTNSITLPFKIKKGSQIIPVPGRIPLYSKTDLAKKKQKLSITKLVDLSNCEGKLSYEKLSGDSCLTISKSTGVITVKKGTKKGTYSMKVKITAAKTANVKKARKTVTIKIKVK